MWETGCYSNPVNTLSEAFASHHNHALVAGRHVSAKSHNIWHKQWQDPRMELGGTFPEVVVTEL